MGYLIGALPLVLMMCKRNVSLVFIFIGIVISLFNPINGVPIATLSSVVYGIKTLACAD